jgi:UDPglucose 6-dehydrogenase
MKISKICCIGAGFVGGPTMAVIALKCPKIKVTVVDKNEEKINAWNGNLDNLPVYEPGLSKIIKKVRNVNLFFSSEIDKAIQESDMIFMAVNTPTKKSGKGKGYAADLKYVEECAKNIGKVSNSNKIIVEKSTLPVRTAEKIKEIINLVKKPGINFEIISNPEFLAEGTAINDLFKSDRVLIGGDRSESGKIAVQSLFEIYNHWIPEHKIIKTNVWSSELSKLVSNAMLAQRISSINSISALCEKTEADIDEVSKAVGMDTRIGKHFLKSSIGFGGSCFKKDILNLVYISRLYGLNEVADYWESVVSINNYQTERVAMEIIKNLKLIKQKTVSILGWAFKKNTNDSRESASIHLASTLLKNDIEINIYDPMVKKSKILDDIKVALMEDAEKIGDIKKFLLKVQVFSNPYDSLIDTNIISICTEWDEFKDLDWKEIYSKTNLPRIIVDGRNILNKDKLEEIGFKTFFIGKS